MLSMQRQIRIVAIAIAAISLFFCCNGGANEPVDWILELKPHSTRAKLIEIPVQTGDTVILQFIHSFDKMPVKETMVVTNDGMLELTEAEFTKLGAGYDTAPLSGKYHVENGKIHITEMNIRYPKIPLRIGTIALHELVVGENLYDLTSLFGGGERIDIQLKPTTGSGFKGSEPVND